MSVMILSQSGRKACISMTMRNAYLDFYGGVAVNSPKPESKGDLTQSEVGG